MFQKKSFKLLFILLAGLPISLYAQSIYHRDLSWSEKSFSDNTNINKEVKKLETFPEAIFDHRYKDLSIYTEKFSGNFLGLNILNIVYEDSRQILTEDQKNQIGTQPLSESGVVYDRKKAEFIISILPYRKNENTGKIEKVVSFDLELIPGTGSARQNITPRVYANNSVLKTGDWYKFGISSTGIHKLTYSDLERLGMNPSQIDPRNIRIYGNGGGVLPEGNKEFRYDDLQQNAIIVAGEADGKFDNNDYILFHAFGPNMWNVDTNNKLFQHLTNTYTTESFYFITIGSGPGTRMSTQSHLNQITPNRVINDYNYYLLHEKNTSTGVNNHIKSGRERYGEEFINVTNYDFNFQIPDVINTKPLRLRVDVIGRSQTPVNSSFTLKYNNQTISTLNCPGVFFTYDRPYGTPANTGFLSLIPTENINININYSRPDFTATGYLNYIQINALRKLKMMGNQTSFRSIESYGAGKISQFNFESSNAANTTVLDITDKVNPKIQQFETNANNIIFTLPTDQLREFVAYSGTDFPSPRLLGRIENQDLHGLGFYDFIILTHPDFKSEAERLADFRRNNNNLRTLVITPDKIFNEFGSGTQDASAIRDFMKMFYDRAGNNTANMPKYLLLFGDGSYDNIGYVKQNTNYITTFESRNSIAQFGSYVSDDFYGLLDDMEGDWDYASSPMYGSSAIDVAVGRLPVQTPLQARQLVDKIIHYSNPVTLGDWRNKYVLIADDEDNNLHLNHAENHYNAIRNRTKKFNIDKIYLDSYQQISTPAGNRYPEVNTAFNQRVNSGALVINFIGHGGENGLGHEKILTIEDINSWKGYDNMPVLMTATCSFTRWDDPAFQSAGELALLNPNGGAIALFTTTRIVFANENEAINASFIRALFDTSNVGGSNTLGDIFRQSKNYNNLGLTLNQRNFTLLGDPSLPFATPKYNVVTESVNNIAIGHPNLDTIKAMSTVHVKGYISDKNGQILSNYNGIIYPNVYDKKTMQKTLGQDPGPSGSYVTSYEVQKNIIYKGKASVQNGRFSYSFVVPKDISYNVGYGRLSYYAQLNNADANGSFDSILVGGSSNVAIDDKVGPEMSIFLNDDQFARGGITGENPVLIIKLKDENGINTVGNGIGHNLSAKLTSADQVQDIELNEYYEAKLDSYQEGEVRYPFSKLKAGNYKLSVKAWDVVNNSSEITTEFTVVDSREFEIDKVYNYPNPFTTSTGFQFEHNRPGDGLQVLVQVYTVSGKLVKTISRNFASEGSRISNINWDGKDDFGDKLARGVYVYRMKVKASDGSVSDKFQKLVILN